MHQRAEKRRRQAVEIGFGVADDMPRDEFRRVLEHMDEAMQFAQDIVRNMARGAGFAVQVDRNVGILVAELFVDDDDGEAEFHEVSSDNGLPGARLAPAPGRSAKYERRIFADMGTICVKTTAVFIPAAGAG